MANIQMFPKLFFIANRDRLRQRLGVDGVIAITSNGLLQRSGDTTFAFSQDRNFWYLTGIMEPNTLLIIENDTEYVILPKADKVRDVFDGAIDTTQLELCSGIRTYLSYELGWKRLTATLSQTRCVHTCIPSEAYQERHGFYLNPARKRFTSKLRRKVPGIDFRDLRPLMAELRCAKQPEEIRAIREAVQITTKALDRLRKSTALEKFRYENELEAAISYEFRKHGASGHAYSPIVASGKHATTLHYVANDGQINHKGLTVLDVGAEFYNYSADITRTIASSKLATRAQNVHDTVREIQQYALSLIKPGLLFHDYERQVVKQMGKSLVRLGLISDAQNLEAIRRYYPHAISHFLGLDVHDVGDYSKPLEAGMVITCEPGIYIPEEGIGVRLEDDIVITDNGHDNLSELCSYDAFTL